MKDFDHLDDGVLKKGDFVRDELWNCFYVVWDVSTCMNSLDCYRACSLRQRILLRDGNVTAWYCNKTGSDWIIR
jgi:hypothetical protein